MVRMTSEKQKIAILGGSKTIREKSLHYFWPPITRKIKQAVLKQLDDGISIYDRSGIFKEFEDAFARYYGRKYALLFSSGTLAIHAMYVVAGLRPGDEVICPAYTFFATVTPLLSIGAIPVLCDCDGNGNIDPKEIKKKITKRTKAVIVTHLWGIPCKMNEIMEICKSRRLLLLEDCSHAHGAVYKGKRVGTFGDMAAWSLQGQKIVTGGEGGILLTDNKDFYYRALLLGHYNKRCKQEIPEDHPLYKYSLTGMGLKYRAHPLAIAIASEIFKELENYLSVKRIFAERIIKELNGIRGIIVPQISSDVKPSWYSLVLQYKQHEMGGLPIETFVEALRAEGLSEIDRPGSTCPLNLLPLFQTPQELFPIYKKHQFSYKPGDFPRAEQYYRNAIKLPVWTFQKDQKIVDAYIRGIKKVVKYHHHLLEKCFNRKRSLSRSCVKS